MNPLFLSIMNLFLQEKRRCPKCGTRQSVPKIKRKETVVCRICGARIPPEDTG